jgi:sporulation protein YlmC with PRC-barrel domain
MLKHLLATTAVVLVLSVPSWAQDPAATEPSTEPLPPVEGDAGATAQTEAEGTGAGAAPAAEEPLAEPAEVAGPAAEDTPEEAVAARAVPDAVITAQSEAEVRAGELVGMTVVSADGQEVGEVSDLIFDEEDKLSGIVVGMGGFLGIGEKLVGIEWSKAEVQAVPESDKEQIFVGLTATDLEAAPDFMTKQDVQRAAEAEAAAAAAAAAAAQSDPGLAPQPATTDTQ